MNHKLELVLLLAASITPGAAVAQGEVAAKTRSRVQVTRCEQLRRAIHVAVPQVETAALKNC